MFEITLFTSKSGVLTKTIRRGADGKLESISANLMYFGSACRLDINRMGELADLLNSGLDYKQAIANGVIRADKPDRVTVTRVQAMETLEQAGAAHDCIARSKQYIEYREQDTLFYGDTDLAQAPARVRDQLAAGCRPWDVFRAVCPGLDGCGHAMRRSTSSGIIDTETGQVFADNGGWHTFWGISDGTDLEAFTKWLHDSCVLVGFGWGFVTACGTILRRSIIDLAVASASRLIYEAAPIVEAPLWQDPEKRRATYADGPAFDSRSRRERTAAEKAAIDAAWRAEEDSVRERAVVVRADWIERKASEMHTRTGKSLEHCRRVAEKWIQCELFPEAVLEFRYLGFVSVAEVWENPRRYHDQELADPREGSAYKSGLSCAKLYLTKDGRPWINSFAHGGAQYALCREEDWHGNAAALGDAYARRLNGMGPIPDYGSTEWKPLVTPHRGQRQSNDPERKLRRLAFDLFRKPGMLRNVAVNQIHETNNSKPNPIDPARVNEILTWVAQNV
jgi:hypothetical protein